MLLEIPEPRYDLELKTMVPGFELFFDCENKIPKLKKEDASWVSTDWANYMDLDAITTLLGDAICNIEEKEYQEACQHALKSPYEARTDDEDEEKGEAPSDDDEGSDNESDNSSDNSSNDSQDSGDNNNSDSDSDSDNSSSEDYDSQYGGNDKGEPPSDGEDEDVRFFYEDHFDDDVDYYDGDMEDDAEAGDVNIEDGLEAKAKEIENDVEDEDEDVGDDAKAGDENVEEDVEAKGINYDESPIGDLQIGVALLMLVQDQALDMTSMVEKFLSQGHSTIQNLAH